MPAAAKPSVTITRTSAAWKERTGLSLPGTVSLVAVVSVLVLVSLPRLRGFAQHENEVDARVTVRILADELAVWWEEHVGDVPSVEELVRSSAVERALSDADFAGDGRLLRRHGYVFAVVALGERPAGVGDAPGVVRAAEGRRVPLGIHAWPWRHGHSGRVSLLGTADGLVFHHPNTSARWTGLPTGAAAPWSWSWEGWALPR